LKGYTAKSLTAEFPEKSWRKRGDDKLLIKLRDTGTVGGRACSGRPRSARTEENVETVNNLVLSQHTSRRPTGLSVRYHIEDGYSSVHSKCSLFAFSSISAEYQQKI